MIRLFLESNLSKIILLVCVVSFHLPMKAQDSQKKLTLDVKNASLKEFAKAVEKASGYSFIYGEEIRLDKPITLKTINTTLREVLDKAFAGQPIEATIKGSHVLLKKKEIKKSQPVNKRKFTIRGYILDEKSRETLIGANVYEGNSASGTTANEYGFYTLTLPEGEVDLRFSYIGYNPEVKKLNLQGDVELNIDMSPNIELSEIIIHGDINETGINATHMGAIDVPVAMIKSTPALLGESDIMKTIQLMPGVQAGTEGSAGVYVRGGGPDENLILLDGVPLYNVDHLFGFFSVFTPESVKKVSLFKGSYPARFGGRLSSVIDVRTNDGDMRNYHGAVGVGLLSSRFQFEGPIIKDRTSFNISARRSYIDLVAKPFMSKDDKYGYFFYDMNAKINHKFNDKHRLFLSFYNGRDQLDVKTRGADDHSAYKWEDKTKLNWGNLTTALKWNYIISPKLFSNTTVAYTKYRFGLETSNYTEDGDKDKDINYIDDYSSKYKSGIKDWTYNIDFDYHPTPRHHLKFGAGYLYHTFTPEILTSKIRREDMGVVQDTMYNTQSNSELYAHEGSVYLEDNFRIGSRFNMNAGLHASLFSIQNKSYFSLQPRLSARYQITDDISVKASYTKMKQYIHLLSSYTILMPTDLWVPVTKHIKPMEAHQYSLGGYYNGIKGWEFSLEGYYKDMNNVVEYKDGASFMGSSHNWEEKVEMGKGRSYGIELMAHKTIGKTTGWIAYTWAKSERRFSEHGINAGRWFPYKYDRRHNVNVTMTHKFSDRIDIGASWAFYTGGTTTIAGQKTFIIRPDGESDGHTYGAGSGVWVISYPMSIFGPIVETDYVESRNNYRMPCTHHLNIGINFHKKTKHGVRTWNISIYNLYNAMNPAFVYRDFKEFELQDGTLEYRPILKKMTILPFIPSVTYTYKF